MNTRQNPFLIASPLPFEAPPFDSITEADFSPALDEGMLQQRAEIQRIVDDTEAPTFVNTIEAIERSGELLARVSKVFFNLVETDATPALQRIRTEQAPKLAAHRDAIFMNAALHARVKSLDDRRGTLGLDAQSAYLLERYTRKFVRAGAELSAADQATLRALNQEEAALTTAFADKALAEMNAAAVVVDDRAQLDGLEAGEIAAAALAAKERGLDGKWVLTLRNTTQQPQLAALKNRALRQRLLQASTTRGRNGGEGDTRDIVRRLAQLRPRRAKLLGFPDYATFVLDDQMARTPAEAIQLLTQLVPPATARAAAEAARMQKLIDAEQGGFQLGPEDWDFYAERVRKAEYDYDQAQVREYFDLERVLKDGVFLAATSLYGITFKERSDIPVYNPEVRVWEVIDADGTPLALYFGDYYARSSKSGGAWAGDYVSRNLLTGTQAVIFNVTNFAKPAPGRPALLSFDDVGTLFHEFGHALHGIFNTPRYPTLGDVPSDFVEIPSQFNEHWALEPAVMASYAKHCRGGQPMPEALADKIRKSRTFNQGYDTTEYLAAALLDLAWHASPPQDSLQDVAAFETAALQRFGIGLPQVPPRYHTAYFGHIWEGGYSARYYAYLWSELIEADAFHWFKENGGMTRANGQRFRDMILAPAGSQDSAELYRAFRGRDPQIEPLLEQRGLKSIPN